MSWESYGAASKQRHASGHNNYCWEIIVSGVGGIQDLGQSISTNKHYIQTGFLSISGSGDEDFTITNTNTGASGNVSETFNVDSDWSEIKTSFKTGSGSTMSTQIAPANPCTFYFDDYWLIPLDEISISGIPASKANSRAANYSGELKGTRVDGGDALTFDTSKWHFSSEAGTIGAYFNLPWDYDNWEQDFYLFDMDDVLRCYYDITDHKFKFDIYAASNWEDLGEKWEDVNENWEELTGAHSINLESSVQTFLAGWHHIAVGWDNSNAMVMCVDSDEIISYSGTWSVLSLPSNLYVGSDRNGEYQVDGVVDDVFDHDTKLGDTLLAAMAGEERKYLPVNSFLIQEQNASMVRKNVGATV